MNNTLLLNTYVSKSLLFKEDLSSKIKSFIFLFLILSSVSVFSQKQEIYTSSSTWTAPCNVTKVTVEAWGGGGAGGGTQGVVSGAIARSGGGGGGGGFIRSTVTVVPGTTYTITVGAGGAKVVRGSGNNGGDSKFGTVVTANGGKGGIIGFNTSGAAKYGAGGAGGLGGTVTGGTGTQLYNGGAGSVGTINNSGPGGGGAGNGGSGGSATSNVEGVGGAGSIQGGYGGGPVNGRTDGYGGYIPGGGGSGSTSLGSTLIGTTGGNGGNGLVRLIYSSKYCVPFADYDSDYIKSIVTTGAQTNLSNITGAGITSAGYSDYFCTKEVVAEQSSNFNIAYAGNDGSDFGWAVWVDWNNDGTFDATERMYNTTAYVGSGTATIPVTAGRAIGTYTMRIMANYYSQNPTNPCVLAGSYKYGEVEDYKLSVVASTACSADSFPGTITTVLSANTGPRSSSFTASTDWNSSGITGLSYQWEISNNGSSGWSNITGQTGTSANLTAVSTASTARYYRLKITCSSGSIIRYSTVVSFTTTALTYCIPTVSNNSTLYINSFKFVGTLLDPPVNNTLGGGFTDYTNLTPVARQPQGSVMNIVTTSVGGDGGYWRAFVDWNKDGDYTDPGEQVYALTAFYTNALTFGFTIPAGQAPGTYRLRIKLSSGSNMDSCSSLSAGETEDYSFEVIADCAAKVTAVNTNPTDGRSCGAGPVTLSAVGSGTGIKWYASLTGGSPLASTATYTTPTLTETTTYYVTAFSGTCETPYRIPVIARIDPVPVITFSTVDSVCGETTAGVKITASGDKVTEELINEKFGTTGFGKFTQSTALPTATYYSGAAGKWINQKGPFIPPMPPYEGTAPAISSGYFGENFAAIVTDISGRKQILDYLTLTTAKSLVGFENLRVDFDLYYFGVTDDTAKGYFQVEYSTNDGGAWTVLQTITTNQGNPNIWKKISLPVPASALTSTQFKVRFSVFSLAVGSTFYESIAAIDNIRIYGTKPQNSGFNWSSTIPSILYQSNCTTELLATDKVSSICIKPTPAQILANTEFPVTASANFSTGCPASTSVNVKNDAKIWNAASNVWNTANWKPGTAVPDATSCVVIKTPLQLGTGNGLAKNITITNTGSLEVLGGRTLQVVDFIKNENTADKFVINSDANLLQTNDTAVNIGGATVKRNSYMKRQDYTYWGSPVHNQNLKAFSPSTLDTRFSIYNEITDLFVPVDPLTTNFIPGKGYAIRAPNTFPRDNLTYATFVGNFIGVLNNGTSFKNPSNIATSLEFPLSKNSQGYNLVANPYPSNIDFLKLVSENQGKINALAYFWTNINVNPRMQGSGYPGTGYVTNYATLNASAGTPATYSVAANNPNNGALLTSKTPNRYIKVGQGFIVQAELNDNLLFNNSMRTDDVTSNFFNNRMAAPSAVDRFWIQMTTPLDVVTTAAIAYIDGATDGFDLDYDAPMMGIGSDAIFTTLGTEQLAIQGKNYPLNRADIVQLSTSHHADGIYTIAIPLAEGIFNGSQAIYLKDKETGIVTNLSENSYSYAAVKGQSDGRFELFYEAKTVLGTDSLVKETLIVYREGNSFVVKSPTKKITDLEMFDSSGRLIYKVGPNNTKTIVPAESITQGVYILKINQEGEITTRKVMK